MKILQGIPNINELPEAPEDILGASYDEQSNTYTVFIKSKDKEKDANQTDVTKN